MNILPLLLALITSPDIRFSADVVYAPPGVHATYVDSGWSYRRVVCMTDLGLHVREGGHDMLLEDWNAYMDVADWMWRGGK